MPIQSREPQSFPPTFPGEDCDECGHRYEAHHVEGRCAIPDCKCPGFLPK